MTITLELSTWDCVLIVGCLYLLALNVAAALGWSSNKYRFFRTTPGTPYWSIGYIFMTLSNAQDAAGEYQFVLWGLLISLALMLAGFILDYRASRNQFSEQSAQLVADLERMYGNKSGSGTDR